MLENDLIIILNLVNKKITKTINEQLDDKELTLLKYQLLYTLLDNDGSNQDQLAQKLNLNKSIIAKNISLLLQSDYIYRESISSDKRFKKVFLTSSGIAEAEFFKAILSDINAIINCDLSNFEKTNLIKNIRLIDSNLTKNDLKK